jgi:hypothetical protein
MQILCIPLVPAGTECFGQELDARFRGHERTESYHRKPFKVSLGVIA